MRFFSRIDKVVVRAFEELRPFGVELCLAKGPTGHELARKLNPDIRIFTGFRDILDPDWIEANCGDEPLTALDISTIKDNYSTLMHLLARVDGTHSLSQVEKDIYIANGFRLAKKLLSDNKIDSHFYITEPHQIVDYIIYLVGINSRHSIFILQKTRIKNFSLLRSRIDGDINPYLNHYSKIEKVRIGEELDSALSEMKANIERPPDYLRAKQERFNSFSYADELHFTIKMLKEVIRKPVRWLRHMLRIRAKRNYIDNTWRKNPISKYSRQMAAIAGYKKYSSARLPISRPFALLTLQCQPERALTPCAGIYQNQLLVADLFEILRRRNLIGEVDDLIIREHPSQLRPYQRAYLGRNEMFYRNLTKSAHCHLSDNSHNTAALMRDAEIVLGTTGSTCFEALLLGKNVIAMGDSWFKFLDYFSKVDGQVSDIQSGKGKSLVWPVCRQKHIVRQLLPYVFEYQANWGVTDMLEDAAEKSGKSLARLLQRHLIDAQKPESDNA